MANPLASPTEPPAADAREQATLYSENAHTMMRTLKVAPTPKHYSLFYACAAGQPTELVREIEQAILRKQEFTDEFIDRLHTSYMAEAQTRAVQDSANSAKKILSEMMQNVTHFAGATSAAGENISQQLQKLHTEDGEETLRILATSLVESATSMQHSSENMTVRLAGAQQEIMELRQNLARVVTESERDFLTGSFNRKAFDRFLSTAVEETRLHDSELTLLMLDIDHFKLFNDKHGHLIGDEVLKIVAKTLADTLKGTDCVARYGGEEFAVILPNTPIAGGMIVAEIIRKSIAGKELKRKSTGENYGVMTVSVGVARLRGDDTVASLIERADSALYQSKRDGRNRVSKENAEG